MIHSFGKSLKLSHSHSDEPWWEQVYRKAFTGFSAAINVRKDGWAQRGGIDRVVVLESGRTIPIDEKVREKVWPDILLERWSDEERQRPGWVQKPLACEYISYAFIPNAHCYLLPTLTLQKAWWRNGRDWVDRFPEVRAQNKDDYGNKWVTLSVAVPIDILLSALSEAMLIKWSETS